MSCASVDVEGLLGAIAVANIVQVASIMLPSPSEGEIVSLVETMNF